MLLRALLILLTLSHTAQAVLKIDITSGNSKPVSIAIPKLAGKTPNDNNVSNEVTEVINNNLINTGLFAKASSSLYPQNFSFNNIIPALNEWKRTNANVLVTGNIHDNGTQVTAAVRVWDLNLGEQIIGKSYVTDSDNARRLGHLISDAIYSELTGETGYFDSKIVYIAETGPQTKRIKRLAIMDQDGKNQRIISSGRDLVLTPRFSANQYDIVYMSYRNDRAKVRHRNLQTGEDVVLGQFRGDTFAPRFSPDGSKVLLSVIDNSGNSEIYEFNLKSRLNRKLTRHNAIDTSAGYSPDGKQIVFNSDRGGSSQIYVMDADGSNIQRISHGKGRYATPVWSQRGNYIAFTKYTGGSFYVGVMRPDGSDEVILDSGYLVEGPSFAPNGKIIVYTKQARGGQPYLMSVDIRGNNKRTLRTSTGASDPTWSPLLH